MWMGEVILEVLVSCLTWKAAGLQLLRVYSWDRLAWSWQWFQIKLKVCLGFSSSPNSGPERYLRARWKVTALSCICNSFSVAAVGGVGTGLLAARPLVNMLYSLVGWPVSCSCTASVWWWTVPTYKLRSIEQPSVQTAGLTIHTFIAGAMNFHPDEQADISFSLPL